MYAMTKPEILCHGQIMNPDLKDINYDIKLGFINTENYMVPMLGLCMTITRKTCQKSQHLNIFKPVIGKLFWHEFMSHL